MEQNKSDAERLAELPQEKQDEILNEYTDEELEALNNDWEFWARKNQLIKNIQLKQWYVWLILAGRGWGKMSNIEDDILTQNKGWTKLKHIEDGDIVYGLNGKTTTVIKSHPIQISKQSYELTFDSGEVIKADAEHLWYTISKLEDKRMRRGKRTSGSVKTTQEIYETQKYGKKRETNHRIPIADPLEYDAKEQHIDPYVFGLWLGDGASAGSQITTADDEVIELIRAAGYEVKRMSGIDYSFSNGKKPMRDKFGRFIANGSITSILKQIGVFNNKHISSEYLFGSIHQRMELLKGLMDSDGYAESTGRCEFVSIKKELADHVFQLINSLGIKAYYYKDKAQLNGRIISDRYRIKFRTNIPVFKLTRKLKRQRASLEKGQISRQLNRYIVNVKKTEPTKMRCLTVDSKDHLFLLTKSFIATHNTRTGAETVTEWIENGYKRIALVGQTKKDVRDVMINGESGLIACSKPRNKPRLIDNRGVLIYPNGAVCYIYSDEAPEALRGPQFEKAWVDELAKFKSLGNPEKSAWENLEMGMRLGNDPQVVVTTTPKNKKVIKELVKDNMTAVTRGATYENIKNLASSFIRRIVNKYEGTRLARQELYAEVLEDVEGALWNLDMIEKSRIIDREGQESEMPEFIRIVVGADPAVTNNINSDETGIIVAALGTDREGYILDDASIKASVNGWAKEIIKAYHENKADLIIGEVNNGGDLIELNIRIVDDTVAYKGVHAARGKQTRAEPVVNLYEQGRIHHYGNFPKLEDEMTSWVPGQGKSPNRVDALVWGITELMLGIKYDPDRFEMS